MAENKSIYFYNAYMSGTSGLAEAGGSGNTFHTSPCSFANSWQEGLQG